MANKKITDLNLIGSVEDDVSLPGDDGVQTYRLTAAQLKAYINNAIESRLDLIEAANWVNNSRIADDAVQSRNVGYSNHHLDVLNLTPQGATHNAFTKLTYSNVAADKSSAWASNTYTVPETGEYLINLLLSLDNNGTLLRPYIYKNGVLELRGTFSTNGTDEQWGVATGCLKLNSGDTIEFYGWHQAGGGRLYSYSRASIIKIPG